jgi:hypothetical protein
VPSTPWNITGDTGVGTQAFSEGSADQNFWFNPKAFAKPAAGTFVGPGTRNQVYNAGLQNWTAALFKTFAIYEQHRVTFRSEFYNFPNHPTGATWKTIRKAELLAR